MRLYKVTLIAIFILSFFYAGQIAGFVAVFIHPFVQKVLEFDVNPKLSFMLIALITLFFGYTLLAAIAKLISLVEIKNKKEH